MVRTLSIGMIAAALALGACSKKDEATKKPAKPTPTKPTPNTATTKVAPADKPASADLASVMKAYEAIRAALADDNADVAAHAKQLAAAAKATTVAAPGKQALTDVANAADTLAGTPAADLAAVRKHYGELSKATVALLAALPDEAKKYHVFECPMATGYKRWVQPDKKLANPYMGKKMLACGSEVALGGQ